MSTALLAGPNEGAHWDHSPSSRGWLVRPGFILLLGLLVAPAFATEYECGDLQIIGRHSLGASSVMAPGGPAGALALTPAYSNFTNWTQWSYGNGGPTLIGTNTITRLVADDILPIAGYAGLDVTRFRFTMGNPNPEAISVRPRVRIYLADGVEGGPGTYVTGFSFNPITLPAATGYWIEALLSPGRFSMPGTRFWAGITFDDKDGTTGITADELSHIGEDTCSPATIGTTTEYAFLTTSGGSFASDNPAGSFFNAVGVGGIPEFPGPVPASFGWEFSVDDATPAQQATWGRLKTIYR